MTYDPYTGRAYHNAGDYVYGAEELQKAMDNRNTDNRINASIFDYVFEKTGNPNMARHAVNTANFTPGVGTAMGLEDAYQAGKNIPDGYREGDRMDMAKNSGLVALGLGDAALVRELLRMEPGAAAIVDAEKQTARLLADTALCEYQGSDNVSVVVVALAPPANGGGVRAPARRVPMHCHCGRGPGSQRIVATMIWVELVQAS